MGLQFKPTDLLEIGELRDLHAVEPDFPAQAPGAEGGIFPIVLDETDIVGLRIDAKRFQGAQIKVDDVEGRGLEHHLILIVVLHPVGVFAVTTVFGAPRRLHIGRPPGFRSDRPQEGRGMGRAGANFHIIGLQQRAALSSPVLGKR